MRCSNNEQSKSSFVYRHFLCCIDKYSIMSEKKSNLNPMRIYQHTKGKYQRLNNQNQTPRNFVIGQKFKIGTGVVLVETSPSKVEKVTFPQRKYKEFLAQILNQEISIGKVISFKWLPKRKIKESTIYQQQCGHECVEGGGCVKLGCICMESEGICK